MPDTSRLFAMWKANVETEMWRVVDAIVDNGTLLSTVSYSKPGDEYDNLWHLDIYECDGKIYKIIYTNFMYVDLELLGTSELEEIEE